jgi:hypothetical protein
MKMIMSFVILAGLLVFVLALLNWMPSLIEPEGFRKYGSIDAVRKKMNVKVYLPAYIPEDLNIRWPPADIYAQRVPFPLVVMHFRYRNSNDIGLVIQEAQAGRQGPADSKIKIVRVEKQSRISIKGRDAVLISAVCDRETPCAQVSWNEQDITLSLTGKIAARDLIRIAGSMLPES